MNPLTSVPNIPPYQAKPCNEAHGKKYYIDGLYRYCQQCNEPIGPITCSGLGVTKGGGE